MGYVYRCENNVFSCSSLASHLVFICIILLVSSLNVNITRMIVNMFIDVLSLICCSQLVSFIEPSLFAVKVLSLRWVIYIMFQWISYSLDTLQAEEKEESVWASALSCLLYFVCDRGKIRRSRLKGLDIRVSDFVPTSVLLHSFLLNVRWLKIVISCWS